MRLTIQKKVTSLNLLFLPVNIWQMIAITILCFHRMKVTLPLKEFDIERQNKNLQIRHFTFRGQ